MDKDTELFDISPKNMTVPLIIAQAICIAVLLAAILIIKLGFGGTFKKIEEFCRQTVLEPTKVSDVMSEENI